MFPPLSPIVSHSVRLSISICHLLSHGKGPLENNSIALIEMSTTRVVITSLADVLVSVAYFIIPAELFYFSNRLSVANENFPDQFKVVLYLFVVFICSCAVTHIVMAYDPFYPTPNVNLVAKLFTGIVSLFTAIRLWEVIPRVLYYPIYTQTVEHENLERQIHEEFLQQNVNIFRQIREYTDALIDREPAAIYEKLSEIICNQLKVSNAVYVQDKLECSTVRLFSTLINDTHELPDIPDSLSYENPTLDVFPNGHNWWLIHFDSGFDGHRGYIALSNLPLQSSYHHRTTRRILVGKKKGDDLPLPETTASTSTQLNAKNYFSDVVIDVVEHFETQLAQGLARQEREELVRQLTAKNEALVKARTEGQSIVKQNRDWLSVMSHEIRTPLFAIESLSELMLERVSKENLEIFKSLEIVNQSANHVMEIINNILDFTKIENGDLQLETSAFDPKVIIEESTSLNVRNEKRMWPQVMLFFEKEEKSPKFVLGDPLRFKQVVTNLINNAVKFTEDEGTVTITLRANSDSIKPLEPLEPENIDPKPDNPFLSSGESKSDQVMVTVTVADTGIGISPEDASKIFNQYTQSDASITRKFGGTGLGLAICKNLASRMGGDVTFMPNDPIGTIFTFTVRLGLPENLSINSAHNENQENEENKTKIKSIIQKTRINVVDDCPLSLECSKKHLEHIGFQKDNIRECSRPPTIDYDVPPNELWLVNMRSKLANQFLTEWKQIVKKHPHQIIQQTNPYLKTIGDLGTDLSLDGPIMDSEVLTVLRLAFERAQKIEKSSVSHSKTYSPLGINVLVAEDSAVIRRVLEQMLTKIGVTANFAEDGRQAVQVYQDRLRHQSGPLIILMDIMMPEMDGYTATREIRKLSNRQTNPWVIALTANAFWEDKVRAVENGMNDFVSKPTKIATLYDALCKGVDRFGR